MKPTRKQREFRQREDLLLDVAQNILLDEGYAGLHMDRIAEISEYAKGTIYKHFTSKEDVLAAITQRNMLKRISFYERALTFGGCPRERMTVVSVADEILYRSHPYHYRALQIIRIGSLLGKTSGERQEGIDHAGDTIRKMIFGVIEDGIRERELVLRGKLTASDVAFGIISLTFGARATMDTLKSAVDIGIGDYFGSTLSAMDALLDGYGWKPLSTEKDYKALVERAKLQLFPEEWRQIERAEAHAEAGSAPEEE